MVGFFYSYDDVSDRCNGFDFWCFDDGQADQFFNVASVPQPLNTRETHEFFARIHRLASAVLALLVTVHVAAVIKHHCSGRPIIKRMFS